MAEELNANCIAELLGQLKMKNGNYQDLSLRYSNCSSQIAEQLLEYLHKGSACEWKRTVKFMWQDIED